MRLEHIKKVTTTDSTNKILAHY